MIHIKYIYSHSHGLDIYCLRNIKYEYSFSYAYLYISKCVRIYPHIYGIDIYIHAYMPHFMYLYTDYVYTHSHIFIYKVFISPCMDMAIDT